MKNALILENRVWWQSSCATPTSRRREDLGGRLFLIVLVLLGGWVLISGVGAAEHGRPFRIGVLTESWGPQPQAVGLREQLLKLGYRENEDFALGVRFTQGNLGALPAAARQLVQYGVDLLFVTTPLTAKAVQQATSKIPIVFAGVGDPVGLGLIQSFARPGGNITGVADLNLALSPKRLQIFHEIIPELKRVLFLYDASDVYAATEARTYRDTAHLLGIEFVEQAVWTEEEARAALTQVHSSKVDGILAPHHVSLNILGFITEATSNRGIPTMFNAAFMVERGALASYGPDLYEIGRQAARLVDKILKGANPAEIPVEVNTKVELTINLKVAKTLGLMIAPEVLYRADRILR